MYHIKKTFLFIFLLWASQASANLLESPHAFGKLADELKVDVATIPEPIKSKTDKAYVMENKFGFDVLETESNWIIEDFLNSIKPGMTVLDSGSGYGKLSREALNQGAIVISNDVSTKELLYNLKKITPDQKKRLYLNNKDIRKLKLPPESLNLIIFHRVLHFFTGSEIEDILKKSFSWLKPGGKIYIVMFSKDHVAIRDKIIFDETKKWPGDGLLDIKKHLASQAYALPDTLHVISKDILRDRVKETGFLIEKVEYVSLKKVGIENNRDGKEAVGIIGIKRAAR